MSFSFLVQNGDLQIQGNQLGIVSGLNKLEQDMQFWVAERYGIDRFHPTYGSALQSYIGGVVTNGTSSLVQGEILRVLDSYSRLQMKAFRANPQLYSLSEILASVDAVNVSVTYDTVMAAVQFTNGSGNPAGLQVTAST
jgi:phage baseplate assembly protein W